MNRFTFYTILILSLIFCTVLTVQANPAEYLTNPSFASGLTSWAVTYGAETDGTVSADASICQDAADSLKGATITGKRKQVIGYATQTIGTDINSTDTVILKLRYWKQSIIADSTINTLKAQIDKPDAEEVWYDIWFNTDIPVVADPDPDSCPCATWTDTGEVTVSNYFNQTGTYKFRWYFDLKSANTTNAQSIAWIDNTSLDVVAAGATITVAADGNQTANMNIPSSDQYVGGAFTFVRDTGSANVTQIIISETGSVNANTNLSNVDIRYETAGTCTYHGTETLFGTAASFDGSENATITNAGTPIVVGTDQICVYVILDVESGASHNDQVEIEITDPSTEITASAGAVAPSSPIAITGTTTLQGTANVIQKHFRWRNDDGGQ